MEEKVQKEARKEAAFYIKTGSTSFSLLPRFPPGKASGLHNAHSYSPPYAIYPEMQSVAYKPSLTFKEVAPISENLGRLHMDFWIWRTKKQLSWKSKVLSRWLKSLHAA